MGRWTLVVLMLACLVRPASAAVVGRLNEAGKAEYARGDSANAERLSASAIEQHPREPLLHSHHAIALTQLGRWREAFRAHETVLGLNPPVDIASASRKALSDLAPLLRIRRAAPPEASSVALERRGGAWFTEVTVNETNAVRFI